MSKSFFEVFPTLSCKEPERSLFEHATVDHISVNSKADVLRIYLSSDRLIMWDSLMKIRKLMEEQLFAGRQVSIYFYETYHLSAQYDPRKLMEVYYDSILMEIKDYSPILYQIFKTAEFQYPEEDIVRVSVEERPFAESKMPELTRILEKILNERCGMKAKVELEYRAPRENRFREEAEHQMALEAAAIAKRVGYLRSETGEEWLGAGAEGQAYEPGSETAPVGAAGERTVLGAAAGETAEGDASGQKAGKAAPKDEKEKASGKDQKVGPTGRKKEGFRGKGGFGGQRDNGKALKYSDNPDVLYKKDIEEDAIALEEVQQEMGEVVVRGKVLMIETREIRGERTIVSITLTDFTDSIKAKLFCSNDQLGELLGGLKEGIFIKLKGMTTMDRFDNELTIGSLTGIRKIPDFTVRRMDNSVRKRVELHCHTKMSDMDGVSECSALVKRAYSWGHPAIAITDHGVVQGFTDANHVWDDLWKAEKGKRQAAGETSPDKQDFFKVIYGVEAYLVDDLHQIVTNSKGGSLDQTYVVFDIETTGLSPIRNRIIEIGAVKVEGGKITDRYSTFVNPEVPIPYEIENLTHIRDDMVIDSPTIETILPEFLAFCEGAILVAHNAEFDMSFIMENCRRQGLPDVFTYVDSVPIARLLFPDQGKHTLDAVAKRLGISLENHHRAVEDAEATAEIFVKFLPMLEKDGIHTLADLNKWGDSNPEIIKRLPTHHAIILAKNNVGRMNLYKLVSLSHLTYFARRPRIPKSEFMKYREGLILGSACEAGELYGALLEGKSDAEIARLVSFYDYLEIQPTGNNRFMIASPRHPMINSVEDIQDVNRRIVELGEQFRKPVVATCDVHFMDPEDEIYRRIIMAGMGFSDADEQAPLYLRTTEEMLEEFEYLGSDKAEEVVITNTNLIADMIDCMSPVRPDKCPPVIENSDQTLTDICYNRAHEIYGPELPEIVEARLRKELNSIISNGFAVMYIIAQKLVWKSVEDGYLVGSRGSVGSSLVAFMSGITEVNSLSPHYICPKCHYYDFDSEEVLSYSGMAGCDMPDKVCPVCGEKLNKDGFDIPFETFLGFKGDKEPDIDLNFSGEYQSKAHKYTEVIFGYGQTYRAGTIASLADKTAYGYVKKYFEERNQRKRESEINRIVTGCTGVRRSTGQHPGGIVVLPVGEEIYSFTPVQHPANDMTTDTITTHFDYHSIDHNLLKLDILGHDDPTMIRMLQDLTGRDPVTIPLDDQGVMSLFTSTEALGITPDQIGGTQLGCLGIPEFGTEFAMQMLIDTHPTHFSDLIRISGLSHGTDVWLGNAQTLIQKGQATISTAICCRDDIMVYLIHMGVESETAFKIMENVRKGKVAKGKCEQWGGWKEDMIAHDVPDWYIWSCEKIKYMFPKAHAAAYVMMAWRIAYCKIYYPLAFYAAFFSIRAKGFSYDIMCQGQKHLEDVMADYKSRWDSLTPAEQDTWRDMKLVQEMYARGFEFLPIDLFQVKAKHFQIIDGKLMPSLNCIAGLGDKAAEGIVEAAKGGPFLSKDDFRDRSKASKTITDMLADLGILGDIPESNQISLFDFM